MRAFGARDPGSNPGRAIDWTRSSNEIGRLASCKCAHFVRDEESNKIKN